MILRDTQATFAGGEFTPALWGRTDFQKYKTGLRQARNVTILPQGGCRNRPGSLLVAQAKDSTHAVRVIPFTASTSQAYVIELGHQYARFYISDAQVGVGSPTAWSGGTAYVAGDLVSSGGTNYYCILAHTNHVPPNATYWYALTGTIMEIPTPWSASDIFDLKFAQSADVMFIAVPGYAPRTLTFTSSTDWVLDLYDYTNGPFLPQNTLPTFTLTPSGLTGSITLTASAALFASTHVGALFEVKNTIVGQTANASLTASVTNWIPTGTTWQCVTTGTWSGTILVQTSPDFITWTTVSTVTTNTTVNGATGFASGYIRAIMQSSLSFSGSASAALTGNGTTTGPTNLGALNAVTASVACGSSITTTITGVWTADVDIQKSTDNGANWTSVVTYTANQAATAQATAETACLIRAKVTAYTSGTAAVTLTGNGPTRTVTISTASVSAAIKCGRNYHVITQGTWTGKILVEISQDQGVNWSLVDALSSTNSANYDSSGETGVRQCLLRVSADPTVTFTGTATVNFTSLSFDWIGVVEITAYTSSTQVTGTVLALSNSNNTGLGGAIATFQWSESAWSDYQGWPSCVAFYKDRLCWGGPQPANIFMSQTSFYTEFSTSSPLEDSDSINVVLPARQLNQIQNLVEMPQFLLALTNDAEFGIAPGQSGVLTPTSVDPQVFGHRGSSSIYPAIVGNELVLIQQMGTVVRNFIFQLAVNGFTGDNISIASQHLFTGKTIVEMAYQQEPDSIIWLIRDDGKMIALTYDRNQEMSALTPQDTDGLYESVCCIPNPTLGINELWNVVNRDGTRFIEALKPRDQGTEPEDQWFLDCARVYDGAPANVITGLSLYNGMEVAVYADGFVIANPLKGTGLTVSGGQITLPNGYEASYAIVGLPYVWDVATLDPDTPNQSGTMQGRRVAQPRVTLRVLDARGGYIGTTDPVDDDSLDGFDEIGDRMQRDPDTDLDTAMPLVSGIVDATPPSGYDYESHICLRGVDPLPFTLLDVIPTVVPGGL